MASAQPKLRGRMAVAGVAIRVSAYGMRMGVIVMVVVRHSLTDAARSVSTAALARG